jgi:L-ascorbate metabolism protein UlaG (beta-lactamase superfamily)
LAKATDKLDATMFPVDPRIGTDFMRGAQQFVDHIKTNIFVPMHFDEAYDKAAAFLPIAQKNGASMPMLRSRGQEIDL